MKKFIVVLAIGLLIYTFLDKKMGGGAAPPVATAPNTSQEVGSEASVERFFAQKMSNVQVGGRGRVVKILADDVQGRKHQKFILQLASGHTLLIVHNIDIAPRIEALRKGDSVDFSGEYEWNDKGGLVHWTHHDPKGRHTGGWLDHQEKRYQ